MPTRSPTTLIIGSRASHLARAMALEVMTSLREAHPAIEFKHKVVMTTGDRDRATSLRQLGGLGGAGAFSKELEVALTANEIDIAVHSLKDLPTVFPEGLALGAVPKREDPRDALCGSTLGDLPVGARVGSGSPRRQAQLLRIRPDLRMVPIRGNVPPRLSKLKGDNPLDAVVLAAAGLRRLDLQDRIAELLPVADFPPAPAQGAIGIEVRKDDSRAAELLAVVHDPTVLACVTAERALLNELRGGCSVPIGAYAELVGDQLELIAMVASLDGTRWLRERASGPLADADAVGRGLARRLIALGVNDILEEVPRPPRG